MLERLYALPVVTVGSVQRMTGTTYSAANELVGRLEEQGILKEITGRRRNRVFRYEGYVGLFEGASGAEHGGALDK